MLSYMRLAQAEASQRLFGTEKDLSDAKYEGNMAFIRGILDVVLYVFTIPPLIMLLYRTWTKRLKYKAKLVKVCSRAAKKLSKVCRCRKGRRGDDAANEEADGGEERGMELAAVVPVAANGGRVQVARALPGYQGRIADLDFQRPNPLYGHQMTCDD